MESYSQPGGSDGAIRTVFLTCLLETGGPYRAGKISETQEFRKNYEHFTSPKKIIWIYLLQAGPQLRQELPVYSKRITLPKMIMELDNN
jgi:hypothetical protein